MIIWKKKHRNKRERTLNFTQKSRTKSKLLETTKVIQSDSNIKHADSKWSSVIDVAAKITENKRETQEHGEVLNTRTDGKMRNIVKTENAVLS